MNAMTHSHRRDRMLRRWTAGADSDEPADRRVDCSCMSGATSAVQGMRTVWQGEAMIDNGGLLESVIDHASQLDDVDYDDIAPTVAELTGSGDVSLVPRLREALDRFLDEENFYGRDLIAGCWPGSQG